jgi:FkbM family methyltransferase
MSSYEIDVVLDVGANTGQFANQLRREVHFAGRIHSFEPLSSAFRVLQGSASRDVDWFTHNFALGDREEKRVIHVSANSYSSSLLDMLPTHAAAAPESRFVGSEEVSVRTLDSIFDEICALGDRVYLKVDTQGYEGRVLRGGRQSLPRVDTVQLEMPLVPLYSGESEFRELYDVMLDEGYVLVALDPGFNDPRTGQLLQVDAVFHRS